MSDAELSAAYATLTQRCGLVDVTARRSLVELRGDDRRAFLHNFSTNDIRNLAADAGCEAFLLNAKGQVLFYVQVRQRPESIVVSAGAERGAIIVRHLERYVIREKVTLADRSGAWSEIVVAGAESIAALQTLGLAPPTADNQSTSFADYPETSCVRLPWSQRVAFAVDGPTSEVDAVLRRLVDAGAVDLGAVDSKVAPAAFAALEALRIEVGLPLDGVDVTDANLAQEIDRNDRTLHFRKGCYLGQETVARLDALGHVNKTLVGLRFSDGLTATPSPGMELRVGEAAVGTVTSCAWSPRFHRYVALAYVRRGPNAPGTQLTSEIGGVEVVGLPQS